MRGCSSVGNDCIFLFNVTNGFTSFKADPKVGELYKRVKVSNFESDPDEVTIIEITEISKDGDDVRYIYRMIDNKEYHDDDPYHWSEKVHSIHRNYEKVENESNTKADRTM